MIRCHDIIVPRTVIDATVNAKILQIKGTVHVCMDNGCGLKVGVDIKGEHGHWRGLQVHVAWSTVEF